MRPTDKTLTTKRGILGRFYNESNYEASQKDLFSRASFAQEVFSREVAPKSGILSPGGGSLPAFSEGGRAQYTLRNWKQYKNNSAAALFIDIESFGSLDFANEAFGISEIAIGGPKGNPISININPFHDKKLDDMYQKAIKKLKEGKVLNGSEKATLKSLLKYQTKQPGVYGTINASIDLKKYIDEIELGYQRVKTFVSPTEGFAQLSRELAKVKKNTLIIGHNIGRFDIPALMSQMDKYGINFSRSVFNNYLDTFDLVRVTDMDLHLGLTTKKKSATLESLGYHFIHGYKGESHIGVEDLVDTRNIINAMTASDRANEIIDKASGKLGNRNLKVGDMLFSTKGRRFQNENDVFVNRRGKPVNTAQNSIMRNMQYRFDGIVMMDDGRHAMKLYSPERKGTSIIYGTLEELQDAIHSRFVTLAVAETQGYTANVPLTGTVSAKQFQYDSALRQYRRMFEYGNENILKQVYGKNDKKMSATTKKMKHIFGDRIQSESQIVQSILKDNTIDPALKPVVARIALESLGEHKQEVLNQFGQVAMEVRDISNGKVGTSGRSVSRIQIATPGQAKSSIYRIISGANDSPATGKVASSKRFMVNTIMDDIIDSKKIDAEGLARLQEFRKNSAGTSIDNMIRNIAEVVSSNYSDGNYIIKKQQIESTSARLLGMDAVSIESAIATAKRSVSGFVNVKNKTTASAAIKALVSGTLKDELVDVSKYTGKSTGVSRTVENIAESLIGVLPKGYSASLLPQYNKLGTLENFALNVYKSDGAGGVVTDIMTRSASEVPVGTFVIPTMQDGIIRYGEMTKISRNIASLTTKNQIGKTYSVYEVLAEAIKNNESIFSYNVRAKGPEYAIKQMNRVVAENISGLASRSAMYADQSELISRYDIGFNLSDYMKANAVDFSGLFPEVGKDSTITKLNYGINIGLKEGEYYGIRQSWEVLKAIGRDAVSRGYYVTGKDSQVSKGIFSFLNVQDLSAFGRMDSAKNSAAAQFANYYGINKVDQFGNQKMLDGNMSWSGYTTNDTLERALGAIKRTDIDQASGIFAQGKLSTSEDISRAIDKALANKNLDPAIRKELEQARFRLSSYENMGIMSEDLAKNLDTTYTKRIALTTEQAEKYMALSDAQGTKLGFKELAEELKLDLDLEPGAIESFRDFDFKDGKYSLQYDVHMPFMSGYKVQTLGGEKGTFSVLSRGAYKAIDHGSGSLFMIGPDIAKHGKMGALIDASLQYKVDQIVKNNSKKAATQQIQALVDSMNKVFESKKAAKPIVLEKNFVLRIAEDITISDSKGDKGWKEISKLIGHNVGDFGVNVFSEIRVSKTDRHFRLYGNLGGTGERGVSFSVQEMEALRTQGYDKTADWINASFKTFEDVETNAKLKGIFNANWQLTEGGKLGDNLPKFGYDIDNAIFDATGVKNLDYAARVKGVDGIVSYKGSLHMPEGLSTGDMYRLQLPMHLSADDFKGTSLQLERDLPSYKKIKGVSEEGFDELLLVANPLGAFDNSLGSRSGFGLGGRESVASAYADIETAIGLISDGDAEGKQRLVHAIARLQDNTSYSILGAHGDFKEGWSKRFDHSGRFHARGVSPLEMINKDSLLYKAGIRENTMIISESAYRQMGGDEKLLKTLDKTTNLFKESEIFGLDVRYPTIGNKSVQGIRIMVGTDDLFEGNIKNAYLTPLLMKDMGGDFDGDTISAILASGIEGRSEAAKEIAQRWHEQFNTTAGIDSWTSQYDGLASKISGRAADKMSLGGIVGNVETFAQVRKLIGASTDEIIEAKVGTTMFTGYMSNFGQAMKDVASITYGSASDKYRAIEEFIATPLTQAPISSKNFTGPGGFYDTMLDTVDYLRSGRGGDTSIGKVTDFLYDLIPSDHKNEMGRARLEYALGALSEMNQSNVNREQIKAFLSSAPEQATRRMNALKSGNAVADRNILAILGRFAEGDQDFIAGDLFDRLTRDSEKTTIRQLEQFAHAENTLKSTWKPSGKTALIALGVAGGLYAFSAVRGMADIASARMQGRPDEAPGSDGYFIPGGAEGHQSPTARVMEAGTGYEGMQINIKAYNSNRTDISDMNARISEMMGSNMTVPVKINTTTRDSRSSMNRDQIQQIIADTIRG